MRPSPPDPVTASLLWSDGLPRRPSLIWASRDSARISTATQASASKLQSPVRKILEPGLGVAKRDDTRLGATKSIDLSRERGAEAAESKRRPEGIYLKEKSNGLDRTIMTERVREANGDYQCGEGSQCKSRRQMPDEKT
jgi:hypothetical protein